MRVFSTSKHSRWTRVAAVLAVCGCSFFVHGSAPEVSLMEARNFVAAREMVAGGSWLLPTMNQELRLAKPPLPTWCVAALQQVTGPTEELGLLRLPAALAATLLVFFFWGLARELTRGLPGEDQAPGRTAWVGALVLASSLLAITTGREGQWDIFANSFMVGALWLLVRTLRQTGPASWVSGLGAGVLISLSFLSKGPVALYAALLPFLIALFGSKQGWARRALAGRRGVLLAGGALALAGSLSWPLYIWEQVAPVALKVARTEIASWGDRHVQPFWYYWSFFAFTGLWALVALVALVWPYARTRAGRFVPYALAAGWLVGGLILLSLVPEKKERYMLPLMPPLALLVAGMLRYWEAQRRQQVSSGRLPAPDVWVLRGWGSLLALVFVAVPGAMWVLQLPGFEVGSVRFWAGLGTFGLLAVWTLGWGVRQVRPGVLMGACLTGMAALLSLAMPAYPVWEARRDVAGLLHMRDVRRFSALRGVGAWRSLDTLHVKQIWWAGRAVPVWHPSSGGLDQLTRPVGVFSSSPVPEHLPAGWQRHVRVIELDSFYLGRERKSGYWFVARLDPI